MKCSRYQTYPLIIQIVCQLQIGFNGQESGIFGSTGTEKRWTKIVPGFIELLTFEDNYFQYWIQRAAALYLADYSGFDTVGFKNFKLPMRKTEQVNKSEQRLSDT